MVTHTVSKEIKNGFYEKEEKRFYLYISFGQSVISLRDSSSAITWDCIALYKIVSVINLNAHSEEWKRNDYSLGWKKRIANIHWILYVVGIEKLKLAQITESTMEEKKNRTSSYIKKPF